TAPKLGHHPPDFGLQGRRAAKPCEQIITLIPPLSVRATVEHETFAVQDTGDNRERPREVVLLSSKDRGQFGGDKKLVLDTRQEVYLAEILRRPVSSLADEGCGGELVRAVTERVADEHIRHRCLARTRATDVDECERIRVGL